MPDQRSVTRGGIGVSLRHHDHLCRVGARRTFQMYCCWPTMLPGPHIRSQIRFGLFRASFLAYLLEATCDIVLNVLFYALLRPVNRYVALLALCFRPYGDLNLRCRRKCSTSPRPLPATDAHVARAVAPEAKATLTYLCLTIYSYVKRHLCNVSTAQRH